MTIDELMRLIEETERLIVVHRNANEVIIGTQEIKSIVGVGS